MTRRVFFDREDKLIVVSNRFVVEDIELSIKSETLGIANEEELIEAIKKAGGINKFWKMADQIKRDAAKKRWLESRAKKHLQ